MAWPDATASEMPQEVHVYRIFDDQLVVLSEVPSLGAPWPRPTTTTRACASAWTLTC